MKAFTHSFRFMLPILLCCGTGFAQETDAPGSRDHKMFSRMPGFYIDSFDQQESASYTFQTEEGPRTVSGRSFRIDYLLGADANPPEISQIIRNHTAAVEALGGHVLLRTMDTAVFRIEEEKTEIWVHLVAWDGDLYGLRIVENKIEPPRTRLDPSAMAETLKKNGRMAVYGLRFDDEKIAVKPESGPVLEVIASLLKQYPDLNLYIVGHTDDQGDLLGNLNRSKRRANLVVRELLNTYGIQPGRLQPYGVGPLAPLVSNDHEMGRARNRRIELVLH